MSTTATNHITIDNKGVARIDGTRMKVIHIAEELLISGASPAEMQTHWPHLTLAQIHAALAYYYDHKAEIDSQIERERKEFEQVLSQRGESPLRKKLRDIDSRS